MLPLLRKIISLCESKENKRHFSLAVRHTRIIVIDLIIVKLFRVCPVVFIFKEKSFLRRFCIPMCNCCFELLILLIILFGTQPLQHNNLRVTNHEAHCNIFITSFNNINLQVTK